MCADALVGIWDGMDILHADIDIRARIYQISWNALSGFGIKLDGRYPGLRDGYNDYMKSHSEV